MIDKVNSMDGIQLYLEQNPESLTEYIELTKYLVHMIENLEGEATRNFLVREGQCWPCNYLRGDVREFLGKRVFAFMRKKQIELLKENLVTYENTQFSVQDVLPLLDFKKIPDSIKQKLDKDKKQEDTIAIKPEVLKNETESPFPPCSKIPTTIIEVQKPQEQIKQKEDFGEENQNKEESPEKIFPKQEEPPQKFTISPEKIKLPNKDASQKMQKTEEYSSQQRSITKELETRSPQADLVSQKDDSKSIVHKTPSQKADEKNKIDTRKTSKQIDGQKTQTRKEIHKIEKIKIDAKKKNDQKGNKFQTLNQKRSYVAQKSEASKAVISLKSEPEKVNKKSFWPFRKKQEDPSDTIIVSYAKVQPKKSDFLEMTSEDEIYLHGEQAEHLINKTKEKFENIEFKEIDLDEYDEIILPQLEKMPHRNLQQIIKGILNRYLYTTQEKFPLMKLRDTITKNRGMLLVENAILVFINHGIKSMESILEHFSQLSTLDELNSAIYNYYLYAIDLELKEHAKVFRKNIENCSTQDDLARILNNYPKIDKSSIKKYPELSIIGNIKEVYTCYTKEKKDIEKIMNKVLGKSEVHIKTSLEKILVKNSNLKKMQDNLNSVYDINSLFKHMRSLKEKPEMKSTANTAFQIIGTFLRGKQKISFQNFKSGLNFLSPQLQNKIIFVVKKKLKKDLEGKVQNILSNGGKVGKRWKKLMRLLQNPQYANAKIKLFGYQLENLREKINSIKEKKVTDSLIKHTFSEGTIPASLLTMIKEKSEKEEKKEVKNIKSCYRDLKKLIAASSSGEICSLKRPITDLFKFYGQINFANSETKPITGYQISREITKFYQKPSREVIELSKDIHPKISECIKEAVENERKRQLKKLQREK